MLKYISQITTSPVPLCPKICILGIYPDDCSLSCKEKKMVDLCLLQAKCSIALTIGPLRNMESITFKDFLYYSLIH